MADSNVTSAGPRPVRVTARRRELALDERGYRDWHVREGPVELQPARTALVLCDVWDHHWCRGAEERLEPLVPLIDRTARAARDLGMLVVHAPSDTMAFYAGHAARARVLEAPPVAPPAEREHDDPPQPVDGSDSSDTDPDPVPKPTRRWSRQHAGVWIDPERDAIGDDGGLLLGLYRQRGIDTVLIAGVHTNMCVLNRTFAIKQMVRWGIPVYLLRDLTDCMYNPARPPYVSHASATEMTVHYIEKFWCPSITGAELRTSAAR
ncbi:MAG: isochorismatase family protein [Spirochaetaceae bacterium]|nr:isochorismatase family protein [Spirochaetaceae bacterium]